VLSLNIALTISIRGLYVLSIIILTKRSVFPERFFVLSDFLLGDWQHCWKLPSQAICSFVCNTAAV
jgi:hypothetical protein